MKFNFKKLIIIFLTLLILVAGIFWFNQNFKRSPTQSDNPFKSQSPSPFFSPSSSPALTARPAPTKSATPTLTPIPSSPSPQSILLDVAFFAQAPFGEWNDPTYQNGCEEAAIIMAMSWVRGVGETKDQAKIDIAAITQFEDKIYGWTPDRSAADTARLLEDYYGYQNVEARSGIGSQDIKTEILKGNLLIVPVNGRILKNPFYTPPGPEHHMIVVIGYDASRDEFITNDIGTRQGQNYRYGASRLGAALQDYLTGDHLPSIAGATAMIIVKK
jgi:hypothetical protein